MIASFRARGSRIGSRSYISAGLDSGLNDISFKPDQLPPCAKFSPIAYMLGHRLSRESQGPAKLPQDSYRGPDLTSVHADGILED